MINPFIHLIEGVFPGNRVVGIGQRLPKNCSFLEPSRSIAATVSVLQKVMKHADFCTFSGYKGFGVSVFVWSCQKADYLAKSGGLGVPLFRHYEI